jgi:glutamine amidotransferase PdxT
MAESITWGAPEHEKAGVVLSGVTREGFIAVADEIHDNADGEKVKINLVDVTVTRNGEKYTSRRKHDVD